MATIRHNTLGIEVIVLESLLFPFSALEHIKCQVSLQLLSRRREVATLVHSVCFLSYNTY